MSPVEIFTQSAKHFNREMTVPPMTFVCFPVYLWKRVYINRNEFAPVGSKFIPLRVDPFSEGRHNYCDRVASPECVYIPL